MAAEGPVFDIMSRIDLFPLTGRFEAGAVLEARVARHDREDSLTRVTFDGGELWIPEVAAAEGASVRLRIRARDIMLARGRPEGISANNVLQADIVAIRRDEGPYLDIQLRCGTAQLLARITHRSLKRLGLEVGNRVYAVIKTATVARQSSRRR